MIGNPILEVRRVSKRFGGVTALDQVSLAVAENQIMGIIGPNGAGKSTFFNVATGVFEPDSGSIRLDGQPIDGLPAYKRVQKGLVRTFQKPHPFVGMTVRESVMVGYSGARAGLFAAMHRLPWVREEERRARAAADKALAAVKLESHADDPSETLPLGRQRHLQIACALMTEPRVLLLDEPASGLNTSETSELAELLVSIRDRGATLVLVEHDMSIVMKICDEIMVLNFGKTLAQGSPKEVRANPEVINAYLGGADDA